MPVGDLLLRLTAPLILLALIVVLIRRKLYRQFPVFFVYLAYALSASGLRIAVKSQPKSYFVIYWSADIIYGILALLVIREVFLPSLENLVLACSVDGIRCSTSSAWNVSTTE